MLEQYHSQRVEAFLQRLREHSDSRLLLEELHVLMQQCFPAPSGPSETQALLLALLEEGERRGLLQLPARNGKKWYHQYTYPLPMLVTLVRDQAPTRIAQWKRFPWHPALAWVADFVYLGEEQEAFLTRVHKGLVNRHFSQIVPLSRRSLELTGNEKQLARWQKSLLFGPGRLSLELLGCVPEMLPLAVVRVGRASSILILENKGSFQSACSALQQMEQPPYGLVAYGAGGGIEESLRFLAHYYPEIQQLHYLGDLDLSGLRIANAISSLAKALSLPEVEPAPGLHQAMLQEAALLKYPEGYPYEQFDAKQTAIYAEQFVHWLPESVQTPVLRIIQSGKRIPEEVLIPESFLRIWQSER